MTSAPEGWTPLAEGETAAQALRAVEAIAHDLSNDPQASPGLSLNQGQTGLALFFAYLERSLGNPQAGERAQHHLEQAITNLVEQRNPAAGLYHGFTGVAWVTEHLSAEESSEDEDEDPNEEIDAALLSLLRQSPWRGEIDLLSGLVGWGVYALERLPRPSAAAMLPLLVARLAECTEPRGSGITWRDPHSGEPDPGMAHGAAGAIALLARVLREGAAGPEAASLLAAAVDGVLSLSPPEDGTEGDLAWCAGDAGLSVALLAASRATGRDDWERRARRLATAAALRYRDEAGVSDPALCHGTAGLSHLFHRLYLATGDPALLAAARRWLERTLALRQPGQGIGGYLRRGRLADGRLAGIPDSGFLGGAAGIGLALLAAATPVEPAWDRLLLLSGRPSRK
ncbi:MAG TPA: lanthionine synthetase LanC family protein [Thermoanaerobaculia bacterium]|nr:lanthionine synthetase LanC family protein [Thermoanaerobaculia bacterium]